MQVTIYLSDPIIAKIDSLAAKSGKSRSACIQEILIEGLRKAAQGTPPTTTLSAFGQWKEITPRRVQEIRRHLGKDARRRTLR